MTKARGMKRFVSLLLVVTLLAGIIPESVYAHTGKGHTGGNECRKETVKGEAQKDCKPDAGSSKIDKETYRGLSYALLATDHCETHISAHCLKIRGNVHVNDSFLNCGDRIHVEGNLEAGRRIVLRTSKGRKSQFVTRRVENAEKISMPDITKEIDNEVKENCY